MDPSNDLIEFVLTSVEVITAPIRSSDLKFEDFDAESIDWHVRWCHQEDLIDADALSGGRMLIYELTPAGYDKLEDIRGGD